MRGNQVGQVEFVAQPLVDDVHLPLPLQHHDAEILLPYLLDRLGRSHEMLLSHLRERITGGIADGSVREVDPDRAALVLLLALQSFAVSGSIVQAHGHAPEIEDEIRHVVTGYLQPVAPPAP